MKRPDEFWIQVQPDGVVVGKQRTNGVTEPRLRGKRMIRVDESFYHRMLHNATDERSAYIPNVKYRLNELSVKESDRTSEKDREVIPERKIATEIIILQPIVVTS